MIDFHTSANATKAVSKFIAEFFFPGDKNNSSMFNSKNEWSYEMKSDKAIVCVDSSWK